MDHCLRFVLNTANGRHVNNTQWWIQDNYGELQVTDLYPRWGVVDGPFGSKAEAEDALDDLWLK